MWKEIKRDIWWALGTVAVFAGIGAMLAWGI